MHYILIITYTKIKFLGGFSQYYDYNVCPNYVLWSGIDRSKRQHETYVLIYTETSNCSRITGYDVIFVT